MPKRAHTIAISRMVMGGIRKSSGFQHARDGADVACGSPDHPNAQDLKLSGGVITFATLREWISGGMAFERGGSKPMRERHVALTLFHSHLPSIAQFSADLATTGPAKKLNSSTWYRRRLMATNIFGGPAAGLSSQTFMTLDTGVSDFCYISCALAEARSRRSHH